MALRKIACLAREFAAYMFFQTKIQSKIKIIFVYLILFLNKFRVTEIEEIKFLQMLRQNLTAKPFFLPMLEIWRQF